MEKITIQTTVNAPIDHVWRCWIEPEHIMNWAFASDDWECPKAENDVRVGGKSLTTMAAKDGSASFDIVGTYTAVEPSKHIAYSMEDGREVVIDFRETDAGVEITEAFDPESLNSRERQQQGWQAILDNFTQYVENQ